MCPGEYLLPVPLAKIEISSPDGVWIAEPSAARPDLTFRVVSTQFDEDIAMAVLEIEGKDVIDILADANETESLKDVELLWKHDTKTIIQIEMEKPLLIRPLTRAGIPLKTPFTISDGTASWELITSHAKLSDLSDEFDKMDISYTVDSIRGFNAEPDSANVTDRQREVLLAANEAGYYDTPRGSSLTELADQLNITKATCSDILHRAEGAVIEQYVSQFDSD
jgi:predicted DNA binding protein